MVEVVQHGDDGAVLAVQPGEDVQQLDMVGDVEEGRRLAEQQDRGLLCQHHGDPDPLALAARELVDLAVGQRRRAGDPHRAGDCRGIRLGPLPEQTLMRIAPARHQIGGGDALGRRGALRQQSQPARDLARGELRNRLAVKQHMAGGRAQQPRQRPQQGGFTAGIGVDDDREAALGDTQRQIARHLAGLVAQGHALGGQRKVGGGGIEGGHLRLSGIGRLDLWLVVRRLAGAVIT